ncbi:YMGG-like glycine zipper-containing protein [Pedobacter sp. KR3-3]|uniref:YMGG-like glycine zipper-containing protein n=1 Tax=Pedobacter albus TaxID=3113905 RepID=A0ABU7I3Z6_9SPHI|nr:YMGG-like glycine zipper-containing protein [Pedobacter sp. KR3-3]MEE1944122.1 YMGG-like glycine zipper-containing protein [Pedobacter sp. KR3-3]
MKRIIAIVAFATVLASCGNRAKEEALAKQQAIAAVKDSLKLDSFKRAEEANKQRLIEEKHQAELAAARRSATTSYSSSGTTTTSSAGTTTAAKKKGWSDAAKGTAIGAGVGALGGILIDKNDARGAIIGGLAGAGAGYAIGRAEDRKSGRVQKKQ